MMEKLIFFCFLMSLMWNHVSSHGRLIKPPARNSAWRYGIFTGERDYNDNENNCGGSDHQWFSNGGKCGLCGDPFDGVQNSMAGGKYARNNRAIAGCFELNERSPTEIDVKVEITSQHKGYFEFRLCVNNDMTKPITQECLDRHLLTIKETGNTRYKGITKNKVYDMTLNVPGYVQCEQCVLQWKWNTGNSWGCNVNTGNCGLGEGPQEQFYGCADISIKENCNSIDTNILPTQAPPTAAPPTRAPQTAAPQTQAPMTAAPMTAAPKTQPPPPTPAPVTNAPSGGNSNNCIPTELYEGNPGMYSWCVTNCAAGHCPASHCTCEKSKRIYPYEQLGPSCDPNDKLCLKIMALRALLIDES